MNIYITRLQAIKNLTLPSMFNPSRPKLGYSSSSIKRFTRSSLSDVRKDYVQVCLMSNLVNQILIGYIRFDVQCPFYIAKNRVFELDHQYMNTFEFVRCSKNNVGICSMNVRQNNVQNITVYILLSETLLVSENYFLSSFPLHHRFEGCV